MGEAASMSTSLETCDKQDVKLKDQLAQHEKLQAATQYRLQKARDTVNSLAPDIGTVADAAAGAAVAASRLKLAAQKLASDPNKISETEHAVEKAAKAHSAQVLAELKVTEAVAYADLS